jgi:hypothetical protein
LAFVEGVGSFVGGSILNEAKWTVCPIFEDFDIQKSSPLHESLVRRQPKQDDNRSKKMTTSKIITSTGIEEKEDGGREGGGAGGGT